MTENVKKVANNRPRGYKEKPSEKKAIAARKNGLLSKGPSKYTEELGDRICEAIASSPHGIRAVLESHSEFPAVQTIYAWQYAHPEFKQKLLMARSIQIDYRIQVVKERAEDDSRDTYINREGIAVPHAVAIARDKLVVDLAKWEASKIATAIYGDKVQNEITVIRHEDTIEALK